MPRRYAIQAPFLNDREPPSRLIEHIGRAAVGQTCRLDLVDHDPPDPLPVAGVSRERDRLAAGQSETSVVTASAAQP